jgi:hypothetical protein
MSDCVRAVAQPQCEAAASLLSEAVRHELACTGERWQHSLLQTLERMYNERPNGTLWSTPVEPRGHRRFDAMMPALKSACKLTSFGRGDGAKRLCKLELQPRCTVISIGSRGDIKFELDVVQRTSCDVHIFDCTVARCNRRRGPWPAAMRTGRVRYHQICIDAHDHIERSARIRGDWKHSSGNFSFRTYSSIVQRLGLTSVSAMKMDIEGFEYNVLADMLRERSAALPAQIAFELHWQTQMTTLPWHHRARTAGEIALFARSLYDAGYRALSRSDKYRCPHCSEFNVVRLFCPPPREREAATGGAGANEGQASAALPSTVDDDGAGWGPADPGQGC